jgi:hypothetical protein
MRCCHVLMAVLACSALVFSADAARSLQQEALSNSNGCLDTIPKCETGACATRNVMGVARWVCLRCQGTYAPVVTADGQDNIIQCVCPRGTYETASGCARCPVSVVPSPHQSNAGLVVCSMCTAASLTTPNKQPTPLALLLALPCSPASHHLPLGQLLLLRRRSGREPHLPRHQLHLRRQPCHQEHRRPLPGRLCGTRWLRAHLPYLCHPLRPV